MTALYIATDGSCRPEGSRGGPGAGGYGAAICVEGNDYYPLFAGSVVNATVNQMELVAIFLAIQYFHLHRAVHKKTRLVILSDSAYSVSVVNVWLHNWKRNGWKTKSGEAVKNKDLITAIDEEIIECKRCFGTKRSPIMARWVKGHNGHLGNELADKLAQSGSELARVNKESNHVDFYEVGKLPTKESA